MTRGTSIAGILGSMVEDPKPPRPPAPPGVRLDAVALRIEELSMAVAEQTERLLDRPDAAPHADLAAILEAAKRSSELARELVTLARLERDTVAAALLDVTQRSLSERPLDSVPAHSHRRVRDRSPGASTVLLVEDEPLLLKTMRRMLEQYGHRVLAASSAVDALAFAASEPALELLVTDLALPGMSGLELVRRLRARQPALRVLYTSGWDPASSGITLANDGSEAFLSKPFSAVELDDRLTELLGAPSLPLAERG